MLDHELVPMFSNRDTQSLAPESNFRQLPEQADPEPLPVPKWRLQWNRTSVREASYLNTDLHEYSYSAKF